MLDLLVEAIGCVPAATNIQLCTCSAAVDCLCRKPQPGMLLNIMKHFGTAPEQTLYVGDLEVDREAARRAGVAFKWAWDFFGWSAGTTA
jgi:D-glycero-D-manno-heptose 1,7-bisphosphate phosphatase